MKKSILEVYKEKPGNYIFAGDGGFGKTMQLLYFQRTILGQSIVADGKRETCIPIYIKLSKINRMERIGDDFFLEKVADYFSDSTWMKGSISSRADGIRNMILNNEEYRYVFLLDGINEVIFRLGVDTAIKNGIWNLISLCKRVNIIISSRSEANQERIRLFPTNFELSKDGIRLEDYFYYYYMKDLNRQSIKAYVGKEINPEMQKILSVPMMAKIYKNILERDLEYEFKQKNELMRYYLMQNTEEKKVSVFDETVDLKILALEEIIPYIAFYVMLYHLEKKAIADITLDGLVERYIKENKPLLTGNLEDVKGILDSMHVVDNELVFSHQLYRDYFAARGLLLHSTGETESVSFMRSLNNALLYDQEFGVDLERRTQYLDLAEFLYSEVGNSLEFCLKDTIHSDNLALLTLSENFYDQLSGVYDDLKERKLSSEIGWTAFGLLVKVKEKNALDEFTVASKANSIFYCILNDDTAYLVGNDREKPLELARMVSEYVENDVHCHPRDVTLKGKYLSNMGAYYTSKWVKPMNYECALLWHGRAFDFRMDIFHKLENELSEIMSQSPAIAHGSELEVKLNQLKKKRSFFRGEVMASYRTIMSDYYHIGNMERAYNIYLDAIRFFVPGMSLEELYCERNILQEDFVERALGAVIARIQDHKEDKESLFHLAELQTAYVFRRCTENLLRPNRQELSSLLSKIEKLCEETEEVCHKQYFREYREKIESILTF